MSRKLVVILLAAVAVATYWSGLRAPFVWDDDIAITTNQSIHQIAESLNPPIETPVAGRPVVNLSLALNYAFGELDPLGYHVFNLAVLIASALLLFGIVRRTLARQLKAAAETSLTAIAMAPALLWMVHPLLSETVYYTTQRTESLMGMFYLLTLYAAIRARAKKRTGRWTMLAVLACAAGMATKESMVTAPIAVVLYDLIFEFESPRDAWKARGSLYLGLAVTWLELAAIIYTWPRSTVGVATTVGPLTYLFNQAQMIARYLWLTVWPHALVVDYGLPRPMHLTDVVLPGLLVVALVAATILALVRWPKVGFLAAMFFLTLAPTSSVIPIASEVGAERRMYLPLAALSVMVVFAAVKFERLAPKKVAIAALTLVVTALAVRTAYRGREFESPLVLWQTAVERWPHGRSRFALGTQLMDAGRHDEATAQLRLAAADYPDAKAGLGTELLLQGKIDEGIRVLDAFVQENPSLPNRIPARVLLAQGHRAVAERELTNRNAPAAEKAARQSIALDAGNADAHNLLGAALASQGNLQAAIPEFRAAVRINPKHEVALKNLAQATAFYGRSNTSNAVGR
jgi:Flp pilus assembly protein TadD